MRWAIWDSWKGGVTAGVAKFWVGDWEVFIATFMGFAVHVVSLLVRGI